MKSFQIYALRGMGFAIIAVMPAVAVFPAAAGEAVIHAFAAGRDGAKPEAGVFVRQKNNRLFGTTPFGGNHGFNYGIVYALTPPSAAQTAWSKSLIYAFQGGPEDGRFPWGRLAAGKNGVLYGTTIEGGTANKGTVFQLTPPSAGQTGWQETVLYSFQGGSDGASPRSGVLVDSSGNLYGTTQLAGDAQCNCGTVFILNPPPAGQNTWKQTVIHTFVLATGDGANDSLVQGELLFDASSNAIFGAAAGGGPYGFGVVYELTPPTPKQRTLGIKTWNETIIYGFAGGSEGAFPNGGLIGGAGDLWGTTQSGGNQACVNGCGTVFELRQEIAGNTTYTPIVWHYFAGTGENDGAAPAAGLFKDSRGALWGTTASGGVVTEAPDCPDGCGAVFKLTFNPIRLKWNYGVAYRFVGGTDGDVPASPLAADAGGALYGTTQGGGADYGYAPGWGTVYRITP